MLGNWNDAEDAAQEVFVKAFQALDCFRGDSSFSTWLFRVTANHCLDLTRHNRRKAATLLAVAEANRSAFVFTSSQATVPAAEHRDMLAKLFARLEPPVRQLLILREIDGLSYEELADVLKCSIDAVKARLKRARKTVVELARHLSAPGTSNHSG